MSTVRAARHLLDIGWRSLGIDRRAAVMLASGCAVVFVCVFALGRAVSPDSAPAQAGASALPSTPASTAVPVQLTTAASIAPAVVVSPPAPVHKRSAGGGSSTGSAVEGSPVTQNPVSEPAPTPTVSRPTPEPSKPTPAPSGGGGGGGTSFDSSG